MDTKLSFLFEEYKKNIENFIFLCQGKTVAFDFDGTLTRVQYAQNSLLPCKDEDIEAYTKSGGNIYHNIYVLKTMEYIVSQLEKNDLWIVTSTVPPLRPIKNKIIVEHFDLLPERIIHTNSSNEKLKVLEDLHQKTNKTILFVEDNFKILLKAEESMNFVRAYHTSSFFP